MKFKVGDIYKDRGGLEYKFLMCAPEAHRSTQLIFMGLAYGSIHTRFKDGTVDHGAKTPEDILPPEKKTVKLYPALYQTVPGRYYTDFLYETCPDDAIRLLTEYPPVVVEVEDE